VVIPLFEDVIKSSFGLIHPLEDAWPMPEFFFTRFDFITLDDPHES